MLGLNFSPKLDLNDDTLEFTDDGQQFITRDGDNLLLWNTHNLKIVHIFPNQINTKILSLSPSARHLALMRKESGEHSIEILCLVEESSKRFYLSDLLPVKGFCWSPDSQYFVYSSTLEVYLGVIDHQNDRSVTFPGAKSSTDDSPLWSFSKDSSRFFYVHHNSVVIYDTTSWTLIQSISSPVNTIGLKILRNIIIVVWNSGPNLKVMSSTGLCIYSDTCIFDSRIKSCSLSETERLMAVCTYSGKVVLFDTISWKRLCILETDSLFVDIIKDQYYEPAYAIGSACSSPYVSSSLASKYTLKKEKNITDIFRLRTSEQVILSFSPNSSYLAAYDPIVKNTISIWDLFATPTQCCSIQLHSRPLDMKWHPFEDLLAVCLINKVVLWRAAVKTKIVSFSTANHLRSLSWGSIQTKILCLNMLRTAQLVYVRDV